MFLISTHVSVIIVNYNGHHLLRECLPTVLDQDYPNYEVVVFDNGSKDKSVRLLNIEYPQVKVFSNSENLGFAGGNNKAVSLVESEYIILLNNDTKVARNFISTLVESIEKNPNIVSVAPRIVRPKGANLDGPQFSHDGFLVPFSYFFFAKRYENMLMRSHICLANAGTAVLYRRSSFLNAGGFDEDFFATFEDFDLGWRLALRGELSLYVPETLVWHKGGSTTQMKPIFSRFYIRNMLSTYFKNLETINMITHIFPMIVFMPILLASRCLVSRVSFFFCTMKNRMFHGSLTVKRAFPEKNFVASVQGIFSFLFQLKKIHNKRSLIQQSRKLTDKEVFCHTEQKSLL